MVKVDTDMEVMVRVGTDMEDTAKEGTVKVDTAKEGMDKEDSDMATEDTVMEDIITEDMVKVDTVKEDTVKEDTDSKLEDIVAQMLMQMQMPMLILTIKEDIQEEFIINQVISQLVHSKFTVVAHQMHMLMPMLMQELRMLAKGDTMVTLDHKIMVLNLEDMVDRILMPMQMPMLKHKEVRVNQQVTISKALLSKFTEVVLQMLMLKPMPMPTLADMVVMEDLMLMPIPMQMPMLVDLVFIIMKSLPIKVK